MREKPQPLHTCFLHKTKALLEYTQEIKCENIMPITISASMRFSHALAAAVSSNPPLAGHWLR